MYSQLAVTANSNTIVARIFQLWSPKVINLPVIGLTDDKIQDIINFFFN